MMSHVDRLYASYDGKVPEAELKTARAADVEINRRIRGAGLSLFNALENMTNRLRQTGNRGDASFIAEAEEAMKEALEGSGETTIEDEMIAALIAAESFISGFEGDELQESIPSLLSQIQRAKARAGAE